MDVDTAIFTFVCVCVCLCALVWSAGILLLEHGLPGLALLLRLVRRADGTNAAPPRFGVEPRFSEGDAVHVKLVLHMLAYGALNVQQDRLVLRDETLHFDLNSADTARWPLPLLPRPLDKIGLLSAVRRHLALCNLDEFGVAGPFGCRLLLERDAQSPFFAALAIGEHDAHGLLGRATLDVVEVLGDLPWDIAFWTLLLHAAAHLVACRAARGQAHAGFAKLTAKALTITMRTACLPTSSKGAAVDYTEHAERVCAYAREGCPRVRFASGITRVDELTPANVTFLRDAGDA